MYYSLQTTVFAAGNLAYAARVAMSDSTSGPIPPALDALVSEASVSCLRTLPGLDFPALEGSLRRLVRAGASLGYRDRHVVRGTEEEKADPGQAVHQQALSARRILDGGRTRPFGELVKLIIEGDFPEDPTVK
jgi:hypothetical protein